MGCRDIAVIVLLHIPTHIPVSSSQASLHGSREDVSGEGSTASHSDVSPGSYGGCLGYFTDQLRGELPLVETLKQVNVFCV